MSPECIYIYRIDRHIDQKEYDILCAIIRIAIIIIIMIIIYKWLFFLEAKIHWDESVVDVFRMAKHWIVSIIELVEIRFIVHYRIV